MTNATANTIVKTLAGLAILAAIFATLTAVTNSDRCHANGAAYPNTCRQN